MEVDVDGCSDQEFVALVGHFNSLSTVEAKAACILSHSWLGEGIVRPIIREIGGKRYAYGFNAPDPQRGGEWLAVSLFKTLSDQFFQTYASGFEPRLSQCTGKTETINLLRAEQRELWERHLEVMGDFQASQVYDIGYTFETLKKTDVFNDRRLNLAEIMNSNTNFYLAIWQCSRGAAAYKSQMYIAELLDEVEASAFKKHTLSKARQTERTPSLSEFIKADFHVLFKEAEDGIRTKIVAWRKKSTGHKIECAGFCEALFVKKWFVGVAPGAQSVNNEVVRRFALEWYKTDISNQLLADKKVEREKQRELFLKRSIW